MRIEPVRLLLTLLAALPSAAWAQSAAQPAKAAAQPPASTVTGVTVTAAQPEFHSAIDRRSYSLGKDLAATTGTVGDVLRNIPSVEVDVQGNVSLRGDPNVTIMVDGKPSGLFRPENRAQALQSMPAGQIDRIEVITNPSAEFNPEGSAGIINIVMKPVRKPGYSGSLRAVVGNHDRYSAGLTGAYNAPKLALTAEASFRGDPLPFFYHESREGGSGAFSASHDDRSLEGRGHILTLQTGLDYDLAANSRLSARARRTVIAAFQDGAEHFASETAGGAPGPAFDSVILRSPAHFKDTEITTGWRRQFPGEEHELNLDLRSEWIANDFRRPDIITQSGTAAPDFAESLETLQDQLVSDLKADYSRPVGEAGKLKAGLEREFDRNDYANSLARGPSLDTLVPLPAFSGEFLFRQEILSAYATFQRPLGALSVQAGLRLEEVRIDVGENNGPVTRANAYRRAYPSLHLSYPVGEQQKLTASYSRRVERPRGFDFNPLPLEQDPLNFSVGDPHIKPQETDSFEAAYEFKRGSTYDLATLFYRRTRNALTNVVDDLGGGVLLNRRANLGHGQSGGLELVANGKLTGSLSYNVSADLYWNEITAANLGFAGARSGYTASGRANLTWQPTRKDFFQINGWLTGRALTPQGFRQPIGVVNLGYRRKLSDDLFVVLAVQDAFRTFKQVVVIDTPTLHDRIERGGWPGAVFLSLTWNFGGAGKKPRDPGFDFGAPPPS
jgi:outer membrane receptor protein involved in Fe transport